MLCQARQHIPFCALLLTATLPLRTYCSQEPSVTDSGVHLVVGLGNPGKAYERTRHNVGKTTVQHFAAALGLTMQTNTRCGCSVSESFMLSPGHSVIFATPMSFMNISGMPVRLLMNCFRVAPENLIVVHDDVDIDFGRVKIKARGSSGGHNGIKSIMNRIGTAKFSRVKLGVGRPASDEAMAVHVLKKMGAGEEVEVRAYNIVTLIYYYLSLFLNNRWKLSSPKQLNVSR